MRFQDCDRRSCVGLIIRSGVQERREYVVSVPKRKICCQQRYDTFAWFDVEIERYVFLNNDRIHALDLPRWKSQEQKRDLPSCYYITCYYHTWSMLSADDA
jgi:hypothetical protein